MRGVNARPGRHPIAVNDSGPIPVTRRPDRSARPPRERSWHSVPAGTVGVGIVWVVVTDGLPVFGRRAQPPTERTGWAGRPPRTP